jgi:hypothetical protein
VKLVALVPVPVGFVTEMGPVEAPAGTLEAWDFETYVKTYRSGAMLDVPELADGTT